MQPGGIRPIIAIQPIIGAIALQRIVAATAFCVLDNAAIGNPQCICPIIGGYGATRMRLA